MQHQLHTVQSTSVAWKYQITRRMDKILHIKPCIIILIEDFKQESSVLDIIIMKGDRKRQKSGFNKKGNKWFPPVSVASKTDSGYTDAAQSAQIERPTEEEQSLLMGNSSKPTCSASLISSDHSATSTVLRCRRSKSSVSTAEGPTSRSEL